jgi:DNA-binding XRE family transcriptional regulator
MKSKSPAPFLSVTPSIEAHIRRLLEQWTHEHIPTQESASETDPTKIDPLRLAPVAEQHLRWYVEQLVDPRYRNAVLERLVEQWGLFIGAIDLQDLTGSTEILARLAWHVDRPKTWPMNVAPEDIASALERSRDPRARQILHELHRRRFVPSPDPRATTPPSTAQTIDSLVDMTLIECAIVVVTEKEVRRDLERPMIAVDAGRAHHDLMTSWTHAPKVIGKRHVQRRVPRKIREEGEPERYEILAPDGRSTQLTLPVEWARSAKEAVTKAIQAWLGPEGVRHWAALLRQLSVEGGRSGSIRWMLERHFDALGYAAETRQDLDLRRHTAKQVELFTKLELAIYAPNGRLRARQPLIAVGTKFDVQRDAKWVLEGMQLQVHPWLYRGVRDFDTGEIGSDWYPAPIELAQIDHRRFPYAIALGLILAMRWRWDWLDGRDHCPLSGEKLLEAAGLLLSQKDPGRTWATLHHTLDELQRRDALGRYEWTGEPWTLAGICRLYPPPWARERTIHGLTPVEALPLPTIVTGAELRAWRGRKGWTQQQAATALGVSLKTLKRAEQAPTEPLGKAICQGLGKLGEASSTGRGQKAG